MVELTEVKETVDINNVADEVPAATTAEEKQEEQTETDTKVDEAEEKQEKQEEKPKEHEEEEDQEEEEEEDEEEEDYDEDLSDETIYERIVALKTIIPPKQRDLFNKFFSFTVVSGAKSGVHNIGKLLWIVSSSALLLGVPLSLSILSEQQFLEAEKEFKMQQESAQVLAPGSEDAFQSAAGTAPVA